MGRERALNVVLWLVGFLFCATAIPVVSELRAAHHASYGPMMLTLYVTLGVFLLLAARNPTEHRSLIGFTAWSSFAHAAVMVVQSLRDVGERGHLLGGSAGLVLIGVLLIALAPRKQAVERGSAVGA